MGLLNRALDEESAGRSFIKKALDMRGTEETLPGKDKKKSQEHQSGKNISINKLLEEIGTLPSTIELPGMLFSVLKKHLSVNKGMFLLPERKSADFKPWASCGYDTTTVHRFKFPAPTAQKLAENIDDPVHFLTPSDLKSLEPFFSSREYSLIEDGVLTIFFYSGTIIGLYLVTDISGFDTSRDTIEVILSVVEELCSPLLWESRHSRMEYAAPLSDQREENIQSILKTARDKKIYGSVADFSGFMEAEKQVNQALDEYRLNQDVAAILGKMCSPVWSCYFLPDKRFLIISEKSYDSAAVKLQIQNAFSILFGELSRKPEIGWEDITLNHSGPDLKEAVTNLFA
ncbi:MAG: hypothetical protein ACLFST_05115 [Spirochaetia bacterium]